MFNYQALPESATLRHADFALLVKEATGKKRILEFGPGISTFAFIEAGAEEIVTLEHDDKWFEKAVERYKDYPQVKVRRYKDLPEATGDLDPGEQFDLAFVDSPKGFKGARVAHPGMEDCSRLNTCILALKHAPIVLLHDAYRPLERATTGRLSSMGHHVSYVLDKKVSIAGIARIIRNGENATGSSVEGAV